MKKLKTLAALFLSIAVVDSLYLTVEHFSAIPLFCPNTGVINCATVLTSRYSVVLGIPLAVAGLIWSVSMLIIFYHGRSRISSSVAPIWYMFGLAGVAYSLASQYLLGHICIYCTTLDTAIILFIVTVYAASRAGRKGD
jgi:uncharacterized membrane protein